MTPAYTFGIIVAVLIAIFGNILNQSIPEGSANMTPGLINPKDLQAKVLAGIDGFDVCKLVPDKTTWW